MLELGHDLQAEATRGATGGVWSMQPVTPGRDKCCVNANESRAYGKSCRPEAVNGPRVLVEVRSDKL